MPSTKEEQRGAACGCFGVDGLAKPCARPCKRSHPPTQATHGPTSPHALPPSYHPSSITRRWAVCWRSWSETRSC